MSVSVQQMLTFCEKSKVYNADLHTAQFTLSGNAVLFTQPNKKIRLKGQKTNKINFLIARKSDEDDYFSSRK